MSVHLETFISAIIIVGAFLSGLIDTENYLVAILFAVGVAGVVFFVGDRIRTYRHKKKQQQAAERSTRPQPKPEILEETKEAPNPFWWQDEDNKED